MKQIKAKIYYETSTGNVLVITAEIEGDVIETTKEEDMKIYEQLKDKNIDEVDYMELPYGTLASTFQNVKSYKVNIENKKLECEYYTQEELEEQRKQYEQQNKEAKELNSRVSNIAEYLNQDTSIMADFEEYILKKEKNKIINGGM